MTGLKQLAQHGYWAVQLGALTAKPKNVNQPQRVVFEANGIPPKKILNEFRVSGKDALVPVGARASRTRDVLWTERSLC